MSVPAVDTSRLPIVVVRFSGPVSDPEFDMYLESMTALLNRAEKTLTILDARRAIRSPPSQRKKQAEWIKTHSEQLRRYSLGTAFVLTSPLVRGVITAKLRDASLATPGPAPDR